MATESDEPQIDEEKVLLDEQQLLEAGTEVALETVQEVVDKSAAELYKHYVHAHLPQYCSAAMRSLCIEALQVSAI